MTSLGVDHDTGFMNPSSVVRSLFPTGQRALRLGRSGTDLVYYLGEGVRLTSVFRPPSARRGSRV